MKAGMKDFLSKLLSVVLGIIITFTLQGFKDKAHTKKEVRSALELVRTELNTNIEDIREMADYLKQERASAQYFVDHRKTLAKCPADSIRHHSSILFADAAISTSSDALELLKNSSLFQKIGDRNLSMKIIRAYDTCQTISASLNQLVTNRNNRFDAVINDKTAALVVPDGDISIKEFIKTSYGFYAISGLTTQAGVDKYTDISDIEAAIEAINHYLSE